MIGPRHLFWDSCVFIRLLTRSPPEGAADLLELVADTKARTEDERRKVFYSTIALAEIRPRYLRAGHGSIDDFFAELGASFEPIDPNPNIMKMAGELRDAIPVDPSTQKPSTTRNIGTPDAIHLCSCLYLRDVLGVTDAVFQTFDQGKGTSWEGRCVPLLSFERWFPKGQRTPLVEDVCSLPRMRPDHPEPRLALAGPGDAAQQ